MVDKLIYSALCDSHYCMMINNQTAEIVVHSVRDEWQATFINVIFYAVHVE